MCVRDLAGWFQDKRTWWESVMSSSNRMARLATNGKSGDLVQFTMVH